MRERGSFVLVTLVLAYGSFYLCRANVESAFPLLTIAFGFTKTQLGVLSSVPIAAYAVGKVVMGAVGDVIGGRRLIALATVGSVLATFAFGASGTLGAFVFFASINRFFQSGGWSGAVSVVGHRFGRSRHGLVMGILSTSYELGNVVALLLCGAITSALPGWRPLFVINPLLFGAIGVGVALALRAEPEPTAGSASVADPAGPGKRESLVQVVAALATKPRFWLAVVLSVLLTFLRIGFLTWTPTYLYEVSRAAGHAAVSGSIAKSAIFPAAGVIAALSIGPITDRFGPGRRAPVMAVSLAMVVGLVLVLAHGGATEPIVAALLIGAVGLFLLGPYSLLAGALALDASGTRGAATAAGIIDGAGYLGASSAGIVIGKVADVWGWSAAFDVIAAAALVAALIASAWSIAVLRPRA
jgi:OPA family glycerol-3-phosphate transporter-like MFS transporter